MQALAFRRLGFTRMVAGGGMRAVDNFRKAGDDLRRSIALYEKLLADEPGDVELRDGLTDAHYYLGFLLSQTGGDKSEAEPSFRRSIALEQEHAVETQDPDRLEHAATRHLELAAWLERNGKPVEATPERRAVLDLYEHLTASAAPGTMTASWAAIVYLGLARALAQHGWVREQEEALRRGLTFVPDHPELLSSLANLLTFQGGDKPGLSSQAIELAKKVANSVGEVGELEGPRPSSAPSA